MLFVLIVILLSTQIHKLMRLKGRKEEEDERHFLDFLRYERKTLERLERHVDKKSSEISRKLIRSRQKKFIGLDKDLHEENIKIQKEADKIYR